MRLTLNVPLCAGLYQWLHRIQCPPVLCHLAAGALFGFSFIWPHVKLLLMHLLYYLPIGSSLRRNGNYWLAFWGKWSLTDALVMVRALHASSRTRTTAERQGGSGCRVR